MEFQTKLKVWRQGTTCYYQPAADRNPVLCIFERPTIEEQSVGRPVVGDTGEHLCCLLHKLQNFNSDPKIRTVNYCSHRVGILNVAKETLEKDSIANGMDAANLTKDQVRVYLDNFRERIDVKHAVERAEFIFCFGSLAVSMLPVINELVGHREVKRICVPHLSGSASRWHKGSNWNEKMQILAGRIINAVSSDELQIDLRKEE